MPPTWPERRLQLWAFVWVVFFRLALRLLPRGRVLRWGEGLSRRAPLPAHLAGPELGGIRRAIERASRRFPGSRCLVQALVARFLYGKRGWHSEIMYGVRKSDGGNLDAHAWLESGGQVVFGDPQPELFTPFDQSGRPGPPSKVR